MFPAAAGYNGGTSGGCGNYGFVKKEELYTIEDIYALPDGKRADYIDAQKGDCEVNIAPFAVF